MSSSDPSTAIALLLRERAWVHALARALTRDEDAADDLEQQTWVAALERPPSDTRSPRGWLATVLHRLAGRSRRSTVRRDRRERAGARPEGMPSASDLVAEAELHRRLIDHVLALDEPFRGALLARYVQGLAPREIAARSGEPVKTVASRLARGLERLRERLDRDHQGDRRAWIAALVPLVGTGGSFGPAAATVGEIAETNAVAAAAVAAEGAAMASKGKVLAAGIGALVVLLGLGVWVFRGERDAKRSAPRAGPSPSAAAAPTTPATLAANPKARVPVAPPEPAGPSVAVPPGAASARWRVEGAVVVEATGLGVSGARIRLALARGSRQVALPPLVADAEGRFGVDLSMLDGQSRAARSQTALLGIAFGPGGLSDRSVMGALPTFASRELRGDPGAVKVQIALRPGGIARGRVVDAPGRPVAGARVAIYGDTDFFHADSDAEGRWEAPMPSAGAGFLLASADGVGSGVLPSLEWPEGRDLDVGDVILRGTGVLAGSVAFADGTPLADVAVFASAVGGPSGGAAAELKAEPGTHGATVRTDAAGRFRLVGLRPGRWRVSPIADGGRDGPGAREVAAGDLDVALRVEGHLLRIHLADETGAPVAGVPVRLSWGSPPSGATVTSGESATGEPALVPADVDVTVVATIEGFPPIEEILHAGAKGQETPVRVVIREGRPPGLLALSSPSSTPPVRRYALEVVTEKTGTRVDFESSMLGSMVSAPVPLPAGRYRVTATPLGADEDESTGMGLPYASAVEIRSGETAHVEVPARRGGRPRLTLDRIRAKLAVVEGALAYPQSGGPPIPLEGWVQRTDGGTQWGAPLAIDPARPIYPLHSLPPGRYRVVVRILREEPREATVDVEVGTFTDAVTGPVAK